MDYCRSFFPTTKLIVAHKHPNIGDIGDICDIGGIGFVFIFGKTNTTNNSEPNE